MGKSDSFTERPIISYEVMEDNKMLLGKALEEFMNRYNEIAKNKNGMMTIADMNTIIDGTVNSFDEDMKKIQIVEGFCELVMSMLKEFGNSVDTFKAVKKIFKFK